MIMIHHFLMLIEIKISKIEIKVIKIEKIILKILNNKDVVNIIITCITKIKVKIKVHMEEIK